ncbi:hypothetical protein JFA41_003877 [Salmonella enterica subsp. enterica serovar Poona]|nr:hypothetical protein [Salmonella enterica subsp. enterica serovar Poona]ELM0493107.1 hypothetical protein [Salmonella enterica]
MSTDKPVNIVITLDNEESKGKALVSCECRINDGNDLFLNHTAAYLASKMQESAQRNIQDAMRYAERKMNKSKQGMH